MVVGFQQISEAVRSEPLPAPGRLVQTHVREIGSDGTLVTAAHLTDDGGRGVMTLLWERTPEGWRVACAQLDEPDPAIDTSVWRQVGNPLQAATGSGPLDGVGMAVADLFQLAGHQVGAGSPAALAVAEHAVRTAPVVEELEAAGAAVTGLAQVDELGLGDTGMHPYGTPRNARANDRLPGGAMSGVAAAVALGQAEVGLGLDTGGSLLLPASYQGLFGLRTTYGLVQVEGVAGVAPSFDTVGWVTRDVDLLGTLAEVLLPEAGRRGVAEVLVSEDLVGIADPDVARAIQAVTDRWDSTVLPLRMVRSERSALEGWADSYLDVRNIEVAAQRGDLVEARAADLGTEVVSAVRAGRAMDDSRRRRAYRAQAAARAAVAELIGDGVLLLPTTATVAPVRDRGGAAARRGRRRTLQLGALPAVGGLPTLTVPLATRRRLACGLSLVGPVGSDHALVALARALVGAGFVPRA